MVENDSDECYIWNSDQFSYDGILTYTDFVEMIMFIFESIQIEKTRRTYLYLCCPLPEQMTDLLSLEKLKGQQSDLDLTEVNFEDRSKYYGLCNTTTLTERTSFI